MISIKLIAALGAGAAGAAWMTSALTSAPKAVPQGGGQNTNVTKLYLDYCSKCHGADTSGGGGGTRTLVSWEKFDQKNDRPFFDAIKNGVKDMGMESFSTLSDKEIWALVVHIREEQLKALRAKFGSPKEVDGVYSSQRAKFRLEEVVGSDQGLRTLWSFDWLPDGTMLVMNRPGFISVVKGGKVVGQVQGVPATREIGQGGFMDITVHPDYAKTGWIYLAITDPHPEKSNMGLTKIVRGKITFAGNEAKWGSQETIWQADAKFYSGVGIHFGSRIVFDRKGHIFFVVGERGGNMLAQELTNPFGKIYRLNEDGSEPADNPFVKTPGAIKGIWSYGHRNPQGLTMDTQGRLWDTEHGPRGGDEVNEIVKGGNYGWPVIAFSINYNDSPFQVPWPAPNQNFRLPVFRWLPSIGACGMDTMNGKAFPDWKGDLIAGGLSGKNVDRIRVKDGKLVEREELIQGISRVRETMCGPDGFVYVGFNEPDRIVRLVPDK